MEFLDSVLSTDSDESCDSNAMRNQLNEYGLDEENLSKQEMVDLLKALKYSKSTAKDDELMRRKVEGAGATSSPQVLLKRRYLNVRDRRLPWSLLPPTITPAEKARTLAVYIKIMSMNTYCQARLSVNMAAWPPPLEIIEETTRVQPIRSTRSGRAFPIYVGFDEDSSDLDITVTRSKKRKESTSETNTNGTHSKKVLSLKRKMSKDENNRPTKELKTVNECNVMESDNHTQASVFELVED